MLILFCTRDLYIIEAVTNVSYEVNFSVTYKMNSRPIEDVRYLVYIIKLFWRPNIMFIFQKFLINESYELINGIDGSLICRVRRNFVITDSYTLKFIQHHYFVSFSLLFVKIRDI